MTPDTPHGTWITTDVPGRLDAMGWSRWHRKIIIALGITWILDGLEASLVANLAPTLQSAGTLGLSSEQVGLANTAYLVGQVIGALGFGHLTDRLGRKKLFLITLGLYLVATALSGLAPNLAVFAVFRLFAGAGIGGEYSAINSAIDELVPARIRGQIDLAINGSYWIGVAFGAIADADRARSAHRPEAIGWRVAFGLGSILGLAILSCDVTSRRARAGCLMHGHVKGGRSHRREDRGRSARARRHDGRGQDREASASSGPVGIRSSHARVVRSLSASAPSSACRDALAGVSLQLDLLQLRA